MTSATPTRQQLGDRILKTLIPGNREALAMLTRAEEENHTLRALSRRNREQIALRDERDAELTEAAAKLARSQAIGKACSKAVLANVAPDIVHQDLTEALELTQEARRTICPEETDDTAWRKLVKKTESSDSSPSTPPPPDDSAPTLVLPESPVKTDDTKELPPVPARPAPVAPPRSARTREKAVEGTEPTPSELLAAIRAIQADKLGSEYVDVLRAYTPEELTRILNLGSKIIEKGDRLRWSPRRTRRSPEHN